MKFIIRRARIFTILVKYIPVLTALIIITHAGLQILEVNDKILDHLVRINPTSALFMFAASCIFKFCWIHKLFIGYDFLMSIEMIYHEEWGLYHTLTVHRVGAIIIGVIIFILLILNRKYFNKCCI